MYLEQIGTGRLLSYVYLEDGTMYNQELLEEGYAKVLKIAPDVKYHKTFEIIQNKAKRRKERNMEMIENRKRGFEVVKGYDEKEINIPKEKPSILQDMILKQQKM